MNRKCLQFGMLISGACHPMSDLDATGANLEPSEGPLHAVESAQDELAHPMAAYQSTIRLAKPLRFRGRLERALSLPDESPTSDEPYVSNLRFH